MLFALLTRTAAWSESPPPASPVSFFVRRRRSRRRRKRRRRRFVLEKNLLSFLVERRVEVLVLHLEEDEVSVVLSLEFVMLGLNLLESPHDVFLLLRQTGENLVLFFSFFPSLFLRLLRRAVCTLFSLPIRCRHRTEQRALQTPHKDFPNSHPAAERERERKRERHRVRLGHACLETWGRLTRP